MDFLAQLDYRKSLAGEYIASFAYPWQALAGLKHYLQTRGAELDEKYTAVAEGVWVHERACIAPSALIMPPCVICAGAQVRHGAFLRGGVLVGEGCVVGNSVELKNCVLFDGAQAPHFNYVGDSILGYRAHMGAGAITSNVRLDKQNISVRGETELQTGLRKFGAIVGDRAEVGCNAVLNPGTIIGRRSVVMPLASVRGVVEEGCKVDRKGVIKRME